MAPKRGAQVPGRFFKALQLATELQAVNVHDDVEQCYRCAGVVRSLLVGLAAVH